MARKDTDTEVSEKSQQADGLETPAGEQAGATNAVAPVETALHAIVEGAAPLADAAASDGGRANDKITFVAEKFLIARPAQAIRVIGPGRGRYRLGRRFGPEPVDIPLDELTEDDRHVLANDPLLTITPI